MIGTKDQAHGPLKLSDLPKKMQVKYKNSIVFARETKSPHKKF